VLISQSKSVLEHLNPAMEKRSQLIQ